MIYKFINVLKIVHWYQMIICPSYNMLYGTGLRFGKMVDFLLIVWVFKLRFGGKDYWE